MTPDSCVCSAQARPRDLAEEQLHSGPGEGGDFAQAALPKARVKVGTWAFLKPKVVPSGVPFIS